MDARRGPVELDQREFETVVRSLIEDAEQFVDANWKAARLDGWERFHGKVDHTVDEGEDATISHDIRDTVIAVLPEVMEQLVGTEENVQYYSRNPQQMPACEIATELARTVFNESGGWFAVYDYTMHCMNGRYGVIKTWKDEQFKFVETDIDYPIYPEQVEMINSTPGMTLVDMEEGEEAIQDPITGEMFAAPVVTRAKLRRYFIEQELKIAAVDPATFFVSECDDIENALCIGQMVVMRAGELVARGIDPTELRDVTGIDESTERREQSARFPDYRSQTKKDHGVWALTPMQVYEAYIKIDADGDGHLECWRVIAVGKQKKVIRAIRVEEHPYSIGVFRRVPHNLTGLSVADLLKDVQEAKTKLIRGVVDNTDLINSPLFLTSGSINIAQLQTWRKHKVVNERVPNAVRTFAPNPVAGETLPVIEMLSGLREERVGTSRVAQGLQPDQLTGTAAIAIQGAQQAAQRMQRLNVRTLAEGALKGVFKKLLRLMRGMERREIEPRPGEIMTVDPSMFDPTWGVRVRVGLGAIAAQERNQLYREVIGLAMQILGSYGPQNPVIGVSQFCGLLHAALREHRGLGLDRFFNSPEQAAMIIQQQAQQPPPPDPKMEDVKRKAQADQGTLQIRAQEAAANAMIKGAELQQKAQMHREELAAKTTQAMIELGAEIPLERYAIDRRAQAGNGRIPNRGR